MTPHRVMVSYHRSVHLLTHIWKPWKWLFLTWWPWLLTDDPDHRTRTRYHYLNKSLYQTSWSYITCSAMRVLAQTQTDGTIFITPTANLGGKKKWCIPFTYLTNKGYWGISETDMRNQVLSCRLQCTSQQSKRVEYFMTPQLSWSYAKIGPIPLSCNKYNEYSVTRLDMNNGCSLKL